MTEQKYFYDTFTNGGGWFRYVILDAEGCIMVDNSFPFRGEAAAVRDAKDRLAELNR